MRSLLIIFLVIILSAPFAFAQYYGAINVDQPGFGSAYNTVRKHRLQIESQIIYRQDAKFPGNSNLERKEFEIANTLIRFGLSKTMELRLSSGLLYRRDKELERKNSLASAQGLSLGGKWNFLKHKQGILPNASLLLQADLPVGSQQVVSRYIEPQAALLVAHPLSDAASFAYNVSVSYRDRDYWQYFYTLAFKVEFSPQTLVFTEFASRHPVNGETEMYFDGGLNLLIKRNYMAYIYGGKGLNTQAADWFVSAGMGVRLPR